MVVVVGERWIEGGGVVPGHKAPELSVAEAATCGQGILQAVQAVMCGAGLRATGGTQLW